MGERYAISYQAQDFVGAAERVELDNAKERANKVLASCNVKPEDTGALVDAGRSLFQRLGARSVPVRRCTVIGYTMLRAQRD